MAIERLERNDGPDSQVDTFVEACAAVWTHVRRITVKRCKGRNPVEFLAGNVVHVRDAKGEILHDERATVEQFVRAAKADAERNGNGEYLFTIWGPRELPTAKRRVVAPDEDLYSMRIRFGEAEEPTSGDASVLTAGANLIKTNASATHDLALSSNLVVDALKGVIDLQQSVIRTQAQQISSSSEADYRTASIQLEIKKLEFNFEVQKETWRREDEHRAAQLEHDLEIHRADVQFKAQLVRDGKQALEFLYGMWAMEKGKAPPPPSDGNGPVQSDGTLLGDFKAVVGMINPDEQAKMRSIVGDDLWNLLMLAFNAKDEPELRTHFESIRRYMQNNVDLHAKLATAAMVIASGNRAQNLLKILVDAGVIPRKGNAEREPTREQAGPSSPG